jgi:hypothetical protein
MREEDALAKLEAGTEAWNQWRKSHGDHRLDLKGVKLRKARLSRADLRNVDLGDAILDGALLFGTNLSGARLCGARFYVASLCGADLRGADLNTAYLRGADLREADLRGADMRDADLRGANLRYCDLRDANVRGADLRDADLRDTDLRGVDLSYVMKANATFEGARFVEEAPKEARPVIPRKHSESGDIPVSDIMEILADDVIQRLREALVDTGSILESELADACDACRMYTEFREDNPKRKWPALTMVAFIEATKPHLMFRAWAALHKKPFEGIRPLCESLYELFGRDFFEGRQVTTPIQAGTSFGEILLAMRVVSADQLTEARALRSEIEIAVGVRLFLGTLLVRSSLVTLGEYYQALAIHYGVPFTGLNDETVARIAEEWGEFTDIQTHTVIPPATTMPMNRLPFDPDRKR